MNSNIFPGCLIAVAGFWTGCQTGGAQLVSIDNEAVPVEYYRMPDERLNPSYTTYSADVQTRFSALSMTGYTETSLADEYLKLSGYKKVNRSGDVEIEASVGDLNASERSVVRRIKSKDKNGKEILRSTYAVEVRYALPISLRVVDKEGHTLEDDYIYRWNDQSTYTTSYYDRLSELDSYWRVNRSSKLADLQRDKIREGFKKIADLINTKYGYQLINENTHFETIGKKKHPEYDAYQTALQRIKDAFKTMDANKGLIEIRNRIQPSLDFYNAEAKKQGTKSKDDAKLKHINLYNQALAYYWLEDFDLATQFAKEIQRFDGKDKDAKRLLQDIEYAKSSLEHAGKSSRHGVMVGAKT
ncbi:MAG: hypothetical protein ABIQ02_11680 [Saprospiraceae bacterium]